MMKQYVTCLKNSVGCVCACVCHVSRGDYEVAEMIGQKSSIAINLLNLVGHPYIALER